MPKNAVVIQHSPHETLGNLESFLLNHQFNIQVIPAWQDFLKDVNPLTPELLIILGGTMGVYEQNAYPFLTTEINLLKERLAKDLPTLGICLGAQLMANALGSNVYPGPSKEIGWGTVSLTAAGYQSCLEVFKDKPVLHWHGDTFDLPANTIRLAASSRYENQAFTVGKNGLALQFHPEVTEREMQNWLGKENIEIKQNSQLNLLQLREETTRNITTLQDSALQCWTRWFKEINVSSVHE